MRPVNAWVRIGGREMNEREIAQFSAVLFGKRPNCGIADEEQSVGRSAGQVSQLGATLRPVPSVKREPEEPQIATPVARHAPATDDQI